MKIRWPNCATILCLGCILSASHAPAQDPTSALEQTSVIPLPQSADRPAGFFNKTFSTRTWKALPGKVLNAVNPFAPTATQELPPIRGVSPRAWSTISANAGKSAFADETTHISKLQVVTFTKP